MNVEHPYRVLYLEADGRGDGDRFCGAGESVAVGRVEVEVLAPDAAVRSEVLSEDEGVGDAAELNAYGFVEQAGGVHGLEEHQERCLKHRDSGRIAGSGHSCFDLPKRALR